MTFTELSKLRVNSQQIGGSVCKSAAQLVSYLGCVQAQEYALTKWSLGLRISQATDFSIEEEFNKGNILRTHVLRPTWHFVSPADIRWMLKLTAPRVHAANAYMYRKVELDAKTFTRSRKIIVKALAAGGYLTRNEIKLVLKKNRIEADGFRLSYLMMDAELEELICSGPRAGNQFTYALLEQKAPAMVSFNKQDALRELSRRYFQSRGPATLKDFSTWSGLTMTDCKNGLQSLERTLLKERINDEDYYFVNQPSQSNKKNKLYLLPVYDKFIMGYKDRSPALVYKSSLDAKSVFRFNNMIIDDGQITGTWRRNIEHKDMLLECDFFEPLSSKQQIALTHCVNQMSRFSDSKIIMK